MRELIVASIGVLVLFAFGRGVVARKQRAKMAAIGFGLLAIGVYQSTIYGLSVMDVLLLRHRLPRFNSLLIVDVPLVLGYGLFSGAFLSLLYPSRSGDST